MIRRWAGTALLGLFAMLLSLALLEGGLRWLAPQYIPDGRLQVTRDTQGVPRLPARQRIVHRDNSGEFQVTVQTNGAGFRESIEPAAIDRGDLVIIGDSFPFGWGVNRLQRVGGQLANLLDRRVVTLALPGLGPLDYRALIEYVEQNSRLPSAFLVFITVENDLAPTPAAATAPVQDRWCVWPCLRHWLSTHTATWQVLAATLKQSEARPWLEQVGVVRELETGVEKSLRHAPDFSQLVDQLSAVDANRMILVIVPSRGLWISEYRQASEGLHQNLVAQLQQTGMPVVDLAPAFLGSGAPAKLHFEHDPHWNIEGHRVAAEAIADHLQRLRPASNP